MKYFYYALRSMWVTLLNLCRKPTTDMGFPLNPRPRPERYRTSFALVHDEDKEEACIACAKCEMICPSQIITVKSGKKRESPATGKKRGYLDDFTLDLQACIFCELCVQVCPTDAILMTRTPHKPGFAREDLLLTMDRLYANEPHVTWATASLLLEMQDPKRNLPTQEGE